MGKWDKLLAAEIEIVEAGEPYTADSVQMLCLKCTIAANCDEENRACLIRVARRRDKKLDHTYYYREHVAEFDEEKAKRRALQKSEAARRYQEKKKRERAKEKDGKAA